MMATTSISMVTAVSLQKRNTSMMGSRQTHNIQVVATGGPSYSYRTYNDGCRISFDDGIHKPRTSRSKMRM